MTRAVLIILAAAWIVCGCSSMPRKRFLIGAGVGGAGGALASSALSPNDESRGLNALVFGLVGAIGGGVLGLLLRDDSELPEAKKPTDSPAKPQASGQEFSVAPSTQNLPAFVQERLKPVIVEELHEPDRVSEDGSLHEPHKVYRIKRQAELISRPIARPEGGK